VISRRTALLALGSLGAQVIAGCRGVGGRGRGLRVVSLSPSTTEAAFAIGAGDRLVGRSKYCDFPPEAAKLPVVGGYADPSIEAIVALSPTLVIGARGPAGPGLETTLRSHGIETFFPETESLAQIEKMLEDLGGKLDRKEGAAAVIGRLRERREAVVKAVSGLRRARVALLFDVAPIVVAGPGGFPDELIQLAGGQNVITGGGPYPTINIERLLALDPDVIVDGANMWGTGGAAEPLAAQRGSPGWRELSAVKQGKVRGIDSGAALRPGPRIGEGLVTLARAIHGDAVAGLL
jgi:iron complex transport system substrate-binding protein